MDVRRLAAIDMYGTRGTKRRQRLILAEFVIGCLVMLGIGAWLLVAADTVGARVFGAWALGAGVNYALLAFYALQLIRPGALDTELAGVDTVAELRRYSVLQFWVFIPLSLVVIDGRRRLRKP